MKHHSFPALLGCLALAACQTPGFAKATIIADGRVVELAAGTRLPSALLRSAGIQFVPGDLILNNGIQVALEKVLPLGESIRLQVIRPIPVLVNGAPVLTTARTVGEAIRNHGLELHAADALDPPAETPIAAGMLISVRMAVPLRASSDSRLEPMLTSAVTLGAALADAGAPLEGLDLPSPSEAQLPHDAGEIEITRVNEHILISQESIPYKNINTDSAELELGLEQVLQPGAPGLAIAITRIRREDGAEVSRQASAQTVAVEPQDRIVVRGTKLVEKTETVNGVELTYWRSLQMYATVYSPCNSGTGDGSCSSGTASGRPAGKGVVAVDPAMYAYLNGQRVYIPGYGFAVIGDIGGGYIIEQNLGISRYKWIDLGFDDNDLQDMTGWVTVYFLAPAPATIPDVLQ